LKEDGSAYWKKLSDSKTNVKANLALGPRNMMVKNYKQWKLGEENNTFQMGVSSVRVPLKMIIDEYTYDNVEKNMAELCGKRSLAIYMILSAYDVDDK